jgi:hypothetical protein
VQSVAVSPGDKLIASGGYDTIVIIGDVQSKQKVFDPLIQAGCTRRAFRPMAKESVDKKVIVQDVNTGALLVSHWVLRGIQRAWTIAWY